MLYPRVCVSHRRDGICAYEWRPRVAEVGEKYLNCCILFAGVVCAICCLNAIAKLSTRYVFPFDVTEVEIKNTINVGYNKT